MPRPETRRGRPLGKGTLRIAYRADDGDDATISADPDIPPRLTVCPRCGVPFAWTTAEVLRRCTELARRAS